MIFPYMYQGDSLVLVIEGKQHTISRETHPNYNKVVAAMKDGDWDAIPDLVDMTRAIANYTSENGDIQVKDGDVYFEGRPFHNAITDRLIAMLEEDFPVEPLCNFMANLKENPSKRSVDELYMFLESNSLPITPDGHFLAYKKVRGDFTDIHSGTFDNSIGNVVSMPRNEVNEDRDRTCSDGLHFCSLEYLPHFGWGDDNRVLILKINPRDVVSIPSDYNNAKGRTCRYEVVGEKDGGEGRDTTEAFDSIVVGDFDDSFPDFEAGIDFEDFFADDDTPREVYYDGANRARYSDDGRYASKQAADEYEDFHSSREHSASVVFDDIPREVQVTIGGQFQYTDNGQFASRAAYLEWQDYLDEV